MVLYLIDGNSYFYRAYHAIKRLSNSKGIPTNAVYGFTTMMLKIVREKKPDALAIVFDSPLPTERHRLYEHYKAQRPETPGDLVVQIPRIKEIINAFNIPVFEMPGYEADDVICTLARKAALQQAGVFIVTGDKDMMQAINTSIRIYDPMKEVVIDDEYIRERFGMPPENIVEIMALTGDAVDNIPGVKGIGEKTAKSLLLEAGGLDKLLSYPERIENKRLRKMVIENIEQIRLSKALVTVDGNVPVEANLPELRIKEPDWGALLRLFTELEFSSLVKLIPSGDYAPRGEYITIVSIKHLQEFLGAKDSPGQIQYALFGDDINESEQTSCASGIIPELSFDIEATGRKPMSDIIVGIALCREKGKAYYVPIRHSGIHCPEDQPVAGHAASYNVQDALAVLKPVLVDPAVAKTGHNLKYDMLILRQEGVRVQGTLYDTMVASYLLNPVKPDHSLENSASEYLKHKKRPFAEVLGKRRSFAEVPIDEATRYSAEDAELAMELKDVLFGNLENAGLERLYFEIEMPLIYILTDMEETGIKIDGERAEQLSGELERDLEALQSRIYALAGSTFNINSPRQLCKVLFDDLGMKPLKKTKTGYSTSVDVLEELAKSHELPGEILNYRTLFKLKTTYTDTLPELINARTGRIHTSFNQTVTATGRLSSSDPNLQNIPIRGEWGMKIREIFIAAEGHLLVSADYSQIELRILAHMSEDESLIEAFKNNIDVHARTASEIFGVPFEAVTPDMRRMAKVVNFGIAYGMSSYGLSEALSITSREAAVYIENYFNRHTGVKRYIERMIQAAQQHGYVATLVGRRRPLPEITSANAVIRQQAERLAVNTPIQGTAADLIKIAMVRVSKALKKRALSARMLLQIHDELLFEVPENEIDETVESIRVEMESALNLSIPLKVEIGQGKNWAEAH
ncbi:MAG: DNA polymerase I [Nitrospirae bacterium]|nr:DNA polymerase I [Nitrospirota bacterium]